LPALLRQISIVDPRIIVLLGRVAEEARAGGAALKGRRVLVTTYGDRGLSGALNCRLCVGFCTAWPLPPFRLESAAIRGRLPGARLHQTGLERHAQRPPRIPEPGAGEADAVDGMSLYSDERERQPDRREARETVEDDGEEEESRGLQQSDAGRFQVDTLQRKDQIRQNDHVAR
jgi:hypothetical protein